MPTLDHAWDVGMTVTLQSGLLCLMAGVGLLLLRKSAASARHLLLVLTMSALLAVPLLSLLLPHRQVSWPAPLLTPTPPSPARAVAVPSAPEHRVETAAPHAPLPHREPSASASTLRSSSLPSRDLDFSAAAPTRFPTAPTVVVAPGAHIPFRQRAACIQTVLAVWLLGSVFALLRLSAGLIGTRRVTLRETMSDPALSQMVTQLQNELGVRQAVVVRQTIVESALPAPLTWGILRPTLLLPPTFPEWPPERRRMVLLHELAHIRRADWLMQILVQITRALYWFHPMVWWATHRTQEESERACDDMVLSTGVAPLAYAETLLEVLRTMNRSKSSATSPASLLSMARPPIEARLRAILSPQKRQVPSRALTLLASAGAALCTIAFASVQVSAGQTTPAPIRSRSIPGASASSLRIGIPPQRVVTPGLSLASEQNGFGKQSSKAQKKQDTNDVALLRKKLDALEQILMQNQQENTKLRQQIKAMEARNAKAAEVSRAVDTRGREEAFKMMLPEASAMQSGALETALHDLQAQQTLLQKQMQQMEDRYRNGSESISALSEAQAEMETNALRIDATQKQIEDLKAGRNLSSKEQRVGLLRLQRAELEVQSRRAQENLTFMKTHYKIGIVSSSDLSKAERDVALLKTQIDRIGVKLSQEGVH